MIFTVAISVVRQASMLCETFMSRGLHSSCHFPYPTHCLRKQSCCLQEHSNQNKSELPSDGDLAAKKLTQSLNVIMYLAMSLHSFGKAALSNFVRKYFPSPHFFLSVSLPV